MQIYKAFCGEIETLLILEYAYTHEFCVYKSE